MTVTERITETVERTDTTPPILHLYPRDPAHRLSGVDDCPQPGDIALCGFVKEIPQRRGEYDHVFAPSCVVCAAMSGRSV